MLSYIVGDREMQIISENPNGYDVYNFLDSYNPAHSHIFYSFSGQKHVYRYLNNPDNDLHQFYPFEDLVYSAIQCDSIFDFPFLFESLNESLDFLSKEQLMIIYQQFELLKNTKKIVKKR